MSNKTVEYFGDGVYVEIMPYGGITFKANHHITPTDTVFVEDLRTLKRIVEWVERKQDEQKRILDNNSPSSIPSEANSPEMEKEQGAPFDS